MLGPLEAKKAFKGMKENFSILLIWLGKIFGDQGVCYQCKNGVFSVKFWIFTQLFIVKKTVFWTYILKKLLFKKHRFLH
jgi:hypothetical protein